MTSYDETLQILNEMRSRFSVGFSSSDKMTIEKLYLLVCGKRVHNTGCKDCYRDAYIETVTKLKRLGSMPNKSNYVLRAGAIIHPQGTSKFYALNNIPDDVAEKHLIKYPADIALFERYPGDWESRVQARESGKVVEPTSDELNTVVEDLRKEIEAKDAEIETLKAAADNGEKDIEIETLKADLQAANETIEKSKQEAQDEVSSLNKTIAELKVKLADANTKIESQDAEIAKLSDELATAKKSEKKADKKNAATEQK